MLHRVVITGVGLISPLGNTTQETWSSLLMAKSGIKTLDWGDKYQELTVKIGGSIPYFDTKPYLSSSTEQRELDRNISFALRASDEAMKMAGLEMRSAEQALRSGCILGIGLGGYSRVFEAFEDYKNKGLSSIDPMMLFNISPALIPSMVAKTYNLNSINYSTVSACTSGAHAIGEAFQMIKHGRLDFALTGGCESGISPLTIAGFANMRALCSSFNDRPEEASRPFEKNRAGFVLGEGAGILVLEEYEAAKKRGANILCEIKGYGASGDASHITAPAPGGEGAIRAISTAIKQSGLSPEDIDYVNAHGTSTALNDLNEGKAIRHIFGDWTDTGLMVSSTKSMTGHLLGGAGGLEAGICAMSLYHQSVAPTINYDEADPDIILDVVPNEARQAKVRATLSNAFGFGGTNAALLFSQI